jgi:hypothetical protein
MGPRTVVLTFVSAVVAVVAGFLIGGLVREVTGSEHEVAVGVVDAQVGAPIATSSPTAEPQSAEPVSSPDVSADPFASLAPSASPSPDGAMEPCPGAPPRDGCECRERKRNSRWVCPLTERT